MKGWRLFKYAPKDGRPFLFCTEDALDAVFLGRYAESKALNIIHPPSLLYISYTDGSTKNYFRNGPWIKCGLAATHWMPLPKPPVQS